MNEFQTWLDKAGTSELGVRLSKNNTEIESLKATENPTAETITQAEGLSAENKLILSKKKSIEEAKNRLQSIPSDQSFGTNGNGQMPLGQNGVTETQSQQNGGFARPKSIGKLSSFHGVREVQRRDGSIQKLDEERRAYELGVYFMGIMAGNEITRSKYREIASGFGYEYLTMNEGSVGAGGYLVPPEFSSDFIYLQQLFGIFRKYARNIAVQSNDYRQPRRQSSVAAAWEGELATIPQTQMGIDQVQVLLKRLSVLVPFSNELNADSIIGLTDWIVKDSVIQMGYKEDLAGFLGDGTLAYGNTLGVIPGLLAIGSNAGVVTQGTGNTWGAITTGDVENLMGALPLFPGMKPKLFCSNAFYRGVLRTRLATTGGTNLIMLAEGGVENQFDGTEVVISQVLPATTGTAQIPLLYGDLAYSSTFVSKGEYTVFQANQGDNMVAQNFSMIRIDERVGITNHELGSSALGGAIVGLKTGA